MSLFSSFYTLFNFLLFLEQKSQSNAIYVHMNVILAHSLHCGWLMWNINSIGHLNDRLTLKHRETHGCTVTTVANDALELKHQAISILSTD